MHINKVISSRIQFTDWLAWFMYTSREANRIFRLKSIQSKTPKVDF